MPGFDPFTSPTTLSEFLNGLQQPSFNERAEQQNNPISDFRIQQKAAGVTPEFTDDPAAQGSLDQLYVGPDSPDPVIKKMYMDNNKAMLDTALSLDKEWYDLTSIDDEFEAMQRAEKIRQMATNTARSLEQQLAKDLGLPQLQERYLKMSVVPGALDFESTKDRLRQMEAQIRGKEGLLRQQLANTSDGKSFGATGELADQFNQAYDLARQWGIRADELKAQREWSQSAANPELLKKNMAARSEAEALTSLGGKEFVDSLAKDLRTTPDQVLALKQADRLEPETIAYNDFYRKNGKKPSIEDAALMGSDGGQFRKLTTQRIAAAVPGLNESDLTKIFTDVDRMVGANAKAYYNEFYLGKADPSKVDKSKRVGFTAYEAASPEQKAAAIKFGRRKAIQEVVTTAKNRIKENLITPEMYDLELRIDLPAEVRNASKALTSLVPDAFKYTADPKVATDNIRIIAETYQQMKQSSPVPIPNFADVVSPMMTQMVSRINGEVSALDPMILDVSDQAFQAQQAAILRADARMRFPAQAGGAIMPQIQRGIQAIHGAIADALSSAVESSPTKAPTSPMGSRPLQPRTSDPAPQGGSDVPVVPNSIPGFDVPLPQSGPVTPVGNPDRVFANPYMPVRGQLARGASVPVDVLPPNIREILIRNGVDPNSPVPAEAAVRIVEAEKRTGVSFDPNDPLAGRKLQLLLNAHGASLQITE